MTRSMALLGPVKLPSDDQWNGASLPVMGYLLRFPLVRNRNRGVMTGYDGVQTQ
jgi:hypothetical protein